MSFERREAFPTAIVSAPNDQRKTSIDILAQMDFFEGLRVWNMQPARLELRWAE